ncbi:MAG TPA: tryptophan synthase subunit beta, partial [Bacteroidota bacterium]|nr:tryptophan synthase subunit beta [Bacteroidota bacterium]
MILPTEQLPDALGHFGKFGGRFVPETLFSALDDLEQTYKRIKNDSSFQSSLHDLLRNYVGRPTPLYFARQLSRH